MQTFEQIKQIRTFLAIQNHLKMGNNICYSDFPIHQRQGLIKNDSKYLIVYCIYSKQMQLVRKNINNTISPSIRFVPNNFQLTSIKRDCNQQFQKTVNISLIELQQGRISTYGLSNIKVNQQKISIKAYTESGEKDLFKDVIIYSIKDVRLKIRSDLSIKNLQQQQYLNYWAQNQKMTSLFEQENDFGSRKTIIKNNKLTTHTSSNKPFNTSNKLSIKENRSTAAYSVKENTSNNRQVYESFKGQPNQQSNRVNRYTAQHRYSIQTVPKQQLQLRYSESWHNRN